jgi:pSer/pThr/pTyr-binding forkhead associated (FHA) protein
MSAQLLIRRDDGTIEAVAVKGQVRIGSAAQSELRIESEGVLPLHANAGVEAGEYWIRNAGNAGVAVNGEAAVEKRTLRHLDVITVGPGVHVIFSTTAAPLPAQPRSRRAAAPPVPTTPPPPTKMTAVFARPDAAAAFKPADNTILGVVPAAVAPKFEPVDDADPANTLLGVVPAGVAPKFQPVEPDADAPNTILGPATPGVTPKFRPEPEPNTIIEPANRGAVPKFKAPSPDETINQPATSSPPPTAVRAKPSAPQAIKGVTLRGIGGVYNALLGRSVIGRGATATIRIDSEEVSKVHAFLDVTATDVTLTDQKSVNGTAVNGSPTPGPRRLLEGDRVSFATFEFRVEFVRMDGSE